MTASPRHRAGADGHCQVCGPSGGAFPCEAALAAGGVGTRSTSSCCMLFGLAQQAFSRTAGAATDRTWGELDALGAIVLAAAAAEAFINELAEWARQAAENTLWEPEPPPEIGALAAAVVAVEARRGDTPTKFRVALQALTRQDPAGAFLHQQFQLLMRARDGLLHTKLDVQPAPAGALTSDPHSVVVQLGPRGITGIDPSPPRAAIDYLSTRAVARWACNSAAAMVQAVIAGMPTGPGDFREQLWLDHYASCFTLSLDGG